MHKFEIPIEKATQGKELQDCLFLGIKSCREYIEKFDEEKLDKILRLNNLPCKSKYNDAFSLETQRKVFETQFPKLDYTCFALYIAIFGMKENHDLFSEEELLAKEPTIFDVASKLSSKSPFSSRAEMVCEYSKMLDMLPGDEAKILKAIYIEGQTVKEIGARYNIKAGTLDAKRRRALHRLSISLWITEKIRPIHDKTHQIEKKNVGELHLPLPVIHCLMRGGIETIGELIILSEADLLKVRGLGPVMLDCIQEELERCGLSLQGNNSPQR